MKMTHIQVIRFAPKPYFSTKAPSTSTALRQREASVYALSTPFIVLLLFVQNDGPSFHLLNNPG
jgi:hypothetical protein